MKIESTESLFREYGELFCLIQDLPKSYLRGINLIIQNDDVYISLEQIKEWNEEFDKRILEVKSKYKEYFKELENWRTNVETFLLNKLEEK